jgi:hypothetical protein
MKSILKMHDATVTEMPVVTQHSELHERIRARAFELYEQRGGEDGHELDDWLQAEEELTTTAVAA